MRIAGALALVGLVAAFLAAVGPADKIRTTYAWPPAELPTAAPDGLWYTPLLLVRHRPESLSATLPCSRPRALPRAERPLGVLATVLRPERVGGLTVTAADGRLVVRIGDRVLAQAPIGTGATASDCAYRLRLGNGSWSLGGGPGSTALAGELDAMPFVNGIYSSVDLRSQPAPSVEMTTGIHATDVRLLQTVVGILGVLALAAALVLVATDRLPRPAVPTVRLHLADALVGVALLAWWVIAPVIWDDGWVVARERTFASSGGFSTYYDVFGVNLPGDYWVEWLHHWVAESSNTLLVLRLPTLIVLGALWVLCRWTLGRVLGPPQGWADASLWALAAGFLTVGLAWGMTLRPEPVVALLAAGVLACSVRFAEDESAAPLALAAVLVPLALTAHHTGLVALAPLLAVSPQVLRWARRRTADASVLVAASIGLVVVLAFAGSDVEQRLRDARTTEAFGISRPWRDEFVRYASVNEFPWGTTLRRVSVALLVLTVLAFLLGRGRNGRRLLDLPATALALALLLFVATPSKHPWHFGALIGLAALAVASETARIRAAGAGAAGWSARPFLIASAVVVAAAWSWEPRHHWNPVDLRVLGWAEGFDAVLPYSTISVLLPALLLAAVPYLLLRRRRDRARAFPWRVAAWSAPLLTAPVLLSTAGILAGDTVKASAWTLTRQNLESFAGASGCGLADDIVVAAPRSAEPLPAVAATRPPSDEAWIPPAPVAGLPRFVLRAADGALASTEWFRPPASRRVGLFTASAGAPAGVAFEWGRLENGRVETLGTADVGLARESMETVVTGPWTFVAASELGPPPEEANAVRVTMLGEAGRETALAVTAPVTYATERLSEQLGAAASPALVQPNLYLYFPCLEQPRLAGGAVEAPRFFVWFDHPFQPHPYEFTSPFLGVRDLYEVQRLPIGDGFDPPEDVVVYEVERSLPGAREAPPDVRTIRS